MLHIIHNPHSGQAAFTTGALCRSLKKANIPYILHTTSAPEDADQLLDSLSFSSEDRILLIGGDGSLNRLLNHLPEKNPPGILLLPAGSGNDFARGLDTKRGPEAVVALLDPAKRLSPCLLDCGEATAVISASSANSSADSSCPEAPADTLTRRFAVSCGIGYDAGVCRKLNESRLKRFLNKIHLGKLAYLILGIAGIARYRKADVTLSLDNEPPITYKNMAFLSCHNLPFEGGGFAFSPKASARDGKLTICLMTAKTRLGFTLALAASLLKLHPYLPGVHIFECEKANVRVSTPLPFHTDGEVISDLTEFSARSLHEFLPFLFLPGQN